MFAFRLTDSAADLLRATLRSQDERSGRGGVVGDGVPARHVFGGQRGAAEAGRPALRTVSLVFFWIAFAAWLLVVIAGLARLAVRRAPLTLCPRDIVVRPGAVDR